VTEPVPSGPDGIGWGAGADTATRETARDSAAIDGGASAVLPATVVGGWLGAGKTTLVNHLLRHAGGRRIAVLVNDFGEVSIDADLIEGADGGVLSLAGGCMCCSWGEDLFGTLARVRARDPAPDVLLVETSGVAQPGAVARLLRLAPGIQVEAVVVLVDAETVPAQPRFAHQVARGHAVEDAAFDQRQEGGLLLGREGALEAGRQLLPGQAGRVAHEGQGLLLRVDEPLAVRDAGRPEEPVGEA